ncbi:hypothetical protein ACH4VX_26465 [Streptomyces sp. NPDC020731]|uniref:hypothetical protein n=1 Tax=Streptomyces sp. NPDC020731 TaxID=3365085 RepID=UPI003798954D
MTVTDLDRAPATPAPGTDTPLRARPGLHYAPVPGGVYFSGTRGQFVLSGSELMHAVADGCVPLLETGTTEDALVAGFGTERARPAVRHLVAQLRENGLLLDPAAFTEPEPPAEVRARHADALARLAARLDDPYAAFARLRRARVELRGPDTATAPARRGLLRTGMTQVTPTDGRTTPSPALVPVCDPAMYADPSLLVPIPAGGPAVREPSTPAGGPAVRKPKTLTPTGDPVADGAGTTTPAGDPAARRDQAPIPAGDPAVDLPGAGGPPRAVIEFLTGDETWTERHGTLHVPVLLGPGPVLVGPVGTSPAVWAAFRDRARVWAGAEGVEPPAGPVAHSLAGALAAQLLADTLTGVAEPGEAHVVHGPDLTADRVTVTGGPVTEAVVAGLDDAPAEPLPEPAAALEETAVLTARWTGLFASAQGEHLPQMPLALRAAEHRTDRTDTVTAWAAHQETATVAAALAALRDRAAGAAGLTREHWLLDGALRWLAERRDRFEHLTGTAPPLHVEGERILAALRAQLGPAVPVLALARASGVDWPLAEVTADGRSLGAGWGPTAADATYAALCTALAAAQADGTVAALSTDALLTVDDTTRTALRKQLTALATIRGQARRTDPVLGELPFWHGPVTARTAQEPTDADH